MAPFCGSLSRSGYIPAETRGMTEGAAAAAVPERVDIAARLDMEPLPHDFTPDQRLLTGEQDTTFRLALPLAMLPPMYC